MSEPRITGTAYEPDAKLRELLAEVLTEATIDYGEKQESELPGGHTNVQRDYAVDFGEFELSGFETVSPIGMFVSLEGHLGLAASVVLGQALRAGSPSRTYTDELPPPDGTAGELYQDLTAEWYHPRAVEAGADEVRMQNRAEGFEHEPIELAELERYVRVWLSLGEE
jgi:hypothetical protein